MVNFLKMVMVQFWGDHGDHVLVFKKDNNPKTGG